MSPAQLERAIAGPAERAGLELEPGLVAAMVADVTDRPGALPLLQYALTELAERPEGGRLTLDRYQEIGGVSGALARRAEQLFAELGPAARDECRQLFLRLVTLGEGAEDTRRRVRRSELVLDESPGTTQGVIETFGRHRLLSFDRDPVTREPTVEIAHEALLLAWARFRGWIDEARDDLRTRNALSASASAWTAAAGDESFLLRGARLEQTATWAETASVALSPADEGFLRASVARRDEELEAERMRLSHERSLERRSVKRLRALVAVFAVAALVAAGLTLVAKRQSDRAARESRIAQARELAAAATASLDDDVERSLLLAIEAVETTRTTDGTVLPEAEEALHRAVQEDRLVMSLPGLGVVRYSADGSRILSPSSEPGTALVFDATTGEVVQTIEGHGDEPLAHANFSPDGRFISTSSRGEGTVRIWDAETGDPLFTLADPGGEVVCCQAEFSPDGSVVVAPLFDGTMRIWSTDDGGEVARIPFDGSPAFSPDGERLWLGSCVGEWRLPEGGPDAFCVDAEAVTDVSWSTDGALVATAQFNGNLSVWDADTGDNVLTLAPGVAGFPYDVELGEEGTRLAGGFSDGTVRVWELDRGVALPSMTLNAHGSVVQSMKFTPDGTRLATASEDGVVQVWDVGRLGAAEALTVLGTAGFGFSPDGSQLAIGGDDGAVQVYDAASGETIRTVTMPARVWAVAFSPDGQRLAASGERGAIAVWDALSGESVFEVEGLEGGPFFDLAWVDGTTLATTSDAGTTAVWDAETGDQIVSMPRGGQSLALSPDGSLLATTQTADSVTESATITIWNTVTGEPTAELHAEIAQYAVAFSADGSLISAGGLDGRITTWNPSTGRLVSTMSGNLGHIWDLSFAPSGDLLASTSEDGSVRLWDPVAGRELVTVARQDQGGAGGPGFDVGFSPDGSRLAATAANGTLRVFFLDIEDLLARARAGASRVLTDQECRQYLHEPSCPPGEV